MKLTLGSYVLGSTVLATTIVVHTYLTREQFYPAAVSLVTSKGKLMALGNMGFVMGLLLCKLIIKIFLGSLRDQEWENLNDRVSATFIDTLLAMTIFREDFDAKFVFLFLVLLSSKIFHWVVQDRVDYIEHTPALSRFTYLRVFALMFFMALFDVIFVIYAFSVTRSKGPSVMLLFGFEYAVQTALCLQSMVKFFLNLEDLRREGRWDNKGALVLYLDFATDMFKLAVYFLFFTFVMIYYGMPIHIIRQMYVTFRSFSRRVKELLQYRRATANMNQRFPDATPEEITNAHGVCIVCREDMTAAKKLPCGHVLHFHCLRSWLERSQTCPMCMASVLEDRPQNQNQQNQNQNQNQNQQNQQNQAQPPLDPLQQQQQQQPLQQLLQQLQQMQQIQRQQQMQQQIQLQQQIQQQYQQQQQQLQQQYQQQFPPPPQPTPPSQPTQQAQAQAQPATAQAQPQTQAPSQPQTQQTSSQPPLQQQPNIPFMQEPLPAFIQPPPGFHYNPLLHLEQIQYRMQELQMEIAFIAHALQQHPFPEGGAFVVDNNNNNGGGNNNSSQISTENNIQNSTQNTQNSTPSTQNSTPSTQNSTTDFNDNNFSRGTSAPPPNSALNRVSSEELLSRVMQESRDEQREEPTSPSATSPASPSPSSPSPSSPSPSSPSSTPESPSLEDKDSLRKRRLMKFSSGTNQ